MQSNIGEIICQYRQLRKMTQEEFAARLGVTPQAVSKWERGNGLPDVSLLAGICKVLGINADTLLGITEKIVENGNPAAEKAIRNSMQAEPLVLEFGEALIPHVVTGLAGNYVNEKRKELVERSGKLMPLLRIRDNMQLPADGFRILSYDNVLAEEVLAVENNAIFETMIDKVVECCDTHYTTVLNKNIVKIMIDNLKAQYPGVAEDIVPDKISYLRIAQKLREEMTQGKSIRNLIGILEELEAEL